MPPQASLRPSPLRTSGTSRRPRPSPPWPPARRQGGKGSRPGSEKIEVAPPTTPEDRQSQLKLLIAQRQGAGLPHLREVNDHLPSEIVDPEQIEDIVR